MLVEHLGGLHHLARRGEHRRIGEPLLDKLQAHETVVHLAEGRAGELDHVDLDAFAGEVVHQRADQGRDLAVMRGRSVDEVDSEDPQGLLLARGARVQQMNVDDDLGGLLAGTGLKSDANPAPTILGMPVAPGRDRIRKREEGRGVATDPAKTVH